MLSRAVARRYARGLFDAVLAAEPDQLDAVHRHLEQFAELLRTHAGLRGVLASPAIEERHKAGIAEALAERIGCGPLLLRFVRLLAAKDRLDELVAISEAFGDRVDRHRGVIAAEVTTPLPLEDAAVERLRGQLGHATGQTVRLTVRTDPDLLGGLVTRIGDVVYDGSLRHQLRSIERRMAEA